MGSTVNQSMSKDTVRMSINKKEPRRPPTIVINSWDASWLRYSCMPAKSTTDIVAERRKDTELDTAEIQTIQSWSVPQYVYTVLG